VSGGVPPLNQPSLPTNLEQFFEIMELSMDISAYSHRGADLLHVRLLDQDLLGLPA